MTAFGKGTVLANKTPGDNFRTIHNDRRIQWRSIACPDCSAKPGNSCLTRQGAEATAPHRSRRRMAIRAESVYSVADVQYARSLSPNERRAVRKEAGLSAKALAELLGGINVNTVYGWEGKAGPGGPLGARYGEWLRKQIEPPVTAEQDEDV